MNIESNKELWFPSGRREGGVVVVRQLSSLCARMGFRRSVVFLSRFACKPLYFAKWFMFLSEFRQQHRLGYPDDDLVRKKTYRFFAYGLPRSRGHELLVDHFKLTEAFLPKEALGSLWRGLPINIGTVAGRRDSYGLVMRLADHTGTNDEGAFSIKLTRQRDQFHLVTLSFILYRLDGRYTVAVGGIQGNKREDSKRVFVDVTRDMSGLRPKDAALLVVEGIAMRAGADRFLAVSNIRHAINFRVLKNRLKKHADLDSYWIDRGGKTGGEFGFVLPVRDRHPEPPSNRREMYKLEFLNIGQNLQVRPSRQPGPI